MSLRSFLFVLALLVLAALVFFPRVAAAFDVDAYIEHLQQNRNLRAGEFLDAHQPFGPYLYEIPELSTPPRFLGELIGLFQLTEDEQLLLRRHGFMVSERLSYPAYGHAFMKLWKEDMPVFVSSDAILHALHRSYVELLAMIEEEFLAGEVEDALFELHEAGAGGGTSDGWRGLQERYGGIPGMRASLDDVDVYLAVARSLLAGARVPSLGGNDATVTEILGLIAAESPTHYPLFSQYPRIVDWSQFKPRGHYTQSEMLRRYFRAMMWLGRTELRLTEPPGNPPTPDVTQEIVDACLIRELVDGSPARQRLERIDEIIRSLVGVPDNVTLPELRELTEVIGLSSVAELLDPEVMDRFRTELSRGEYTPQGILSQILLTDPMNPEDLDPPFAFLLMGQRLVVDSYVTGQVVYDRIRFEGGRPFRGLPSPLDVLYTLGNDDVLPLLLEELETYHYASNLSALRYLLDSYDQSFWRSSLYNVWLDAIRSLSLSGRREGVPDFMMTGAWQQEKMNTQLASWTELRHDNLLYAKQSYTGGAICEYPCTYVEPIPDLYRILGDFARNAGPIFGGIPMGEWYRIRVQGFFGRMSSIMDTLETVAGKELSGVPLTEEEHRFLGQVMFTSPNGCVTVEDGWYRELFFSLDDNPTRKQDLLIADVHTQPTDEFGAPVGHVLHVATGFPNLGIFLAVPPGGELTAFAGPVASYHEHVTVGFERLTDEEWEDSYLQGPPDRLDWTYVYLADANGNARPDGRQLVRVKEEEEKPTPPPPVRPLLAQNVPNPFGQTTLLSFRVEGAGRVPVDLFVFDSQGRRVRALVREDLPPSTYHVRWDGTDAGGRRAATGIYYAHLRVGETTVTRKMTLIR